MEKKPYSLIVPRAFTEAILWHGNRYETSQFLIDHMFQVDESDDFLLELTEPEMWELSEYWENEDRCFSCGSSDLNSFIDEFVCKMV